jgi:mono/diheme cytochrome c family protein
MTARKRLACAAALLALAVPAAHAGGAAKDKSPREPEKVSYYRDIRPLFQQHCQGCHQPAKAEGGFVMTSHADLLKQGDHEKPGVVPGEPDKSFVVEQITPHGKKPPEMPRGKDPLTDFQVKLIKRWIAAGAQDDTPASARVVIDAEHPPQYDLPPVITALAYSPDGKLLAVSGYHEILLHNADGSGLVARLVGQSERIQSLAFSPDGKWLAMTGGTPGLFGEVQIWNVKKRTLKVSLPITFDTVYGASWAHDGTRFAFGCADNSVRAISPVNGKQILFQGGHGDFVLGTTFSREDQYIISVSRDMSMKLTEVSTQRLIDNITSITPNALKGGLVAVARRPLKEKKMSKVPPDVPGGKPKVYDEVVCVGSDGTPRLYKIHRETPRKIGDDDNRLREYAALPGRLNAVAFNTDGSRFVVGSSLDQAGEARVYKVDTANPLSMLQGQKGPVYAVAYAPDGKQVASAGFDGVVRLSDPETGKLIREFVPCPIKGKTTVTAGAK